MAMQNDRSNSRSPSGLNLTDGLAASQQDTILLLARICVGWIFVQSGLLKLLGMVPFSTRGWPAAWFLGPLGAGVELFFGALLILGLATRYACLIALLFMVIATFGNHRYWEFPADQIQGQKSHFFKNLSIFGAFLVFYAVGAGRYSLDWMMSRGNRNA